MKARNLQAGDAVTQKGDLPSTVLLLTIQRLTVKIAELEARIEALEP